MTRSTEPGDDKDYDLDFAEVPAAMYEFLSGHSINEPMLPGFTLFEENGTAWVRWQRPTSEEET